MRRAGIIALLLGCAPDGEILFMEVPVLLHGCDHGEWTLATGAEAETQTGLTLASLGIPTEVSVDLMDGGSASDQAASWTLAASPRVSAHRVSFSPRGCPVGQVLQGEFSASLVIAGQPIDGLLFVRAVRGERPYTELRAELPVELAPEPVQRAAEPHVDPERPIALARFSLVDRELVPGSADRTWTWTLVRRRDTAGYDTPRMWRLVGGSWRARE